MSLSKVWGLSGSERAALAQALALLPLTAGGLRLVGFRRWQAMLARLAPMTAAPAWRDDADALGQARIVSRMVAVAARCGLYRANCLPQSLVLWWLLRRRGIIADFRIGARMTTGRFEAHAWVEWRGVVLNDGADVRQRFAAFDLPPLGVAL